MVENFPLKVNILIIKILLFYSFIYTLIYLFYYYIFFDLFISKKDFSLYGKLTLVYNYT